MNPDLSIVIPSYCEPRLPAALKAVCASLTGELNVQVLVIDDCSPERAPYEAAKLMATNSQGPHARVEAHRLNRRHGSTGARAAGRDLASAPVVAYLDARTIVAPKCFELLFTALTIEGVIMAGPSVIATPGLSIEEQQRGVVYQKSFDEVWNSTPPDSIGLGRRLKNDYSMELEWLPPRGLRYERCMSVGFCPVMVDTDGWPSEWDRSFAGYYGGEDIELPLRAWRLGYDVVGVPEAIVAKEFRGGFLYGGVTNASHVYNSIRLAALYFDEHVLAKVLAHYHGWGAAASSSVSRLLGNAELAERRAWLDRTGPESRKNLVGLLEEFGGMHPGADAPFFVPEEPEVVELAAAATWG